MIGGLMTSLDDRIIELSDDCLVSTYKTFIYLSVMTLVCRLLCKNSLHCREHFIMRSIEEQLAKLMILHIHSTKANTY